MEQCQCEICNKDFSHDEIYHDDSGSYCVPCIEAYHRQSALDAGIPLSVIDGETKLTDHFSKIRIAKERKK